MAEGPRDSALYEKSLAGRCKSRASPDIITASARERQGAVHSTGTASGGTASSCNQRLLAALSGSLLECRTGGIDLPTKREGFIPRNLSPIINLIWCAYIPYALTGSRHQA